MPPDRRPTVIYASLACVLPPFRVSNVTIRNETFFAFFAGTSISSWQVPRRESMVSLDLRYGSESVGQLVRLFRLHIATGGLSTEIERMHRRSCLSVECPGHMLSIQTILSLAPLGAGVGRLPFAGTDCIRTPRATHHRVTLAAGTIPAACGFRWKRWHVAEG